MKIRHFLFNIFSLLLLIFLSQLVYPKKTYAAILFEDYFNNNDTSQWTVLNGSWESINETYIGTSFYDGREHPIFTTAGDVNWKNYIIEFKMKGIEGVDKSIEFRFRGTDDNYALNIRSGYNGTGNDMSLVKNFPGGYQILKIQPFQNQQNVWYEVKVKVLNQQIEIYVNNFLALAYNDPDPEPSNGKIALQIWPGCYLGSGTYAQTKVAYDDIVVTSIGEPTPTATPTPTPTSIPTPTPSPTPSLTPTPTSTPTPTPTPTPSPTPTPTPTPKLPIVLVPGLGASYNYQALIQNQDISITEWKLLPFIKEYKGLKNTLTQIFDYQQNQNFFIFAYDWRQKIAESANDLSWFLEHTVKPLNQNKKIYLIGHSLGGLVARTYTQKTNNNQVEKIISVGSPHKGALQAYKAWEGAKLEGDPLSNLALNLILLLNNRNFQTPLATLRNIAPVGKDLLPTFDYLLKGQRLVPENTLNHQNTWLKNLNSNIPNDFLNIFTTFTGLKGGADEFYYINNASWLEKTLGYWQDGKPHQSKRGPGDSVVLEKSTSPYPTVGKTLNLNHSELVYTQRGIKEILGAIDISIDEQDVIPSEKTKLSPALFFQLASPAQLEVTDPTGQKHFSEDNLVFIDSPINGPYKATVLGLQKGIYRLFVGQLQNSSSIWTHYEGETKKGQTDTYNFQIDTQSPLPEPLLDKDATKHIELAIVKIQQIKSKRTKKLTNSIIKTLKSAKKQAVKNKKRAIREVKKALLKIFSLRRRLYSIKSLNLTNEAIYHLASTDFNFDYSKKTKRSLKKDLNLIKLQLKIKALFLKIKPNTKKALSYQNALDYCKKAEEQIKQSNYPKAEISLFIAKLFLSEI